MLGNNQTGVRVHNEKLVLSLLRRDGPLARAEIARATGLSAQAVSVIMGALEAEGMLLRGQPVRGKVGQPSVPMRLAPDGAYFFGVMVGRRSIDLVLVDMVGRIRDREQALHDYPDYDRTLDIVEAGVCAILARRAAAERARVGGLGVAMPGRLWDWAEPLGVTPEALAGWRDRDFAADLAERTGMEPEIRNDGSAACAAELVFGRPEAAADAVLHFYVAYFIGGGLILDGRLFTGPSGSAGALGPMVLRQPDGSCKQLLELASLVNLSKLLERNGKSFSEIWTLPHDWSGLEPEVSQWIEAIATPIAEAIAINTGVIDFERVIIDGFIPEDVRGRLVEAVQAVLDTFRFVGLNRPELLEGTMGADARAIGAASVPLARRFLV